MIPSQQVLDRMVSLIGADTVTLFADGNLLRLAKAAFTPSPDLIAASMTEADFSPYNPRALQDAAMPTSRDPMNGDELIYFPPGTEDYLWTTDDVANLPQTIYGFYITDSDGTNLFLSELFATPIVLTGEGQSVTVPTARTRLISGSMR